MADAERARRAADATYRAEVEARVTGALERSLAGFRAQVAEACQTVLGHIESGRPVREGALERLRRTIRRFRALNVVEDDGLERQLATFEQACLDGLDAAAVSQAPDLRAMLAAGLQGVVEAATAELPRSGMTGRAPTHPGGHPGPGAHVDPAMVRASAVEDGGSDAEARSLQRRRRDCGPEGRPVPATSRVSREGEVERGGAATTGGRICFRI